MSGKTQRILSIVLLFSSLVAAVLVTINNPDNIAVLIVLEALLVLSFCLRSFFVYKTKRKNIGKILLFVDILLIFYINFTDSSNFSQIYFYLIVAEAVVFYFSRYGFIYILIGYVSLLLTTNFKYTRWNYFDISYQFPGMVEISFYFIFVIGMIYIAGYQFNQSKILNVTMNELSVKTQQLQETNRKLNETMKSLEEMTALRERNRIAREIHDTIGHTLTTVVIEIEAGKRLVKKDPELSVEKLELAQEQVRNGLNDIRSSVKILKDGSELLPFTPSLQVLIRETEKHAGISVDCKISTLPVLTAEQEKVIYSALQEGLTNGIRHGRSSAFIFSLENANGRIAMKLQDNGVGCGSITLGFGLTAMKERIEEIGGKFDINSSTGQGCCLSIDIPAGKENDDESDQDTCSG
jgi:signal transduction histidine kinase